MFKNKTVNQYDMVLLFDLPDLNKTFCNFGLGLVAEHVCVTDALDEQFELLQQSIPSDADDPISSNSEMRLTTLPPNIKHSSSPTDEKSDDDLDLDKPSNNKRLHQQRRRSTLVREARSERFNNNNPNPFSNKHKGPTPKQNNNDYKHRPLKPVTIMRPRMSYDRISVAYSFILCIVMSV